MRKLFTLFLVLASNFSLQAQLADVKWSTSLFEDRSFIENKGQFDGRTGSGQEQVLYAVDDGPVQIFFTPRGVIYRIDEKEKNYYRQRGDRSKPRMITKSDLVRVEWDGAALGMRVEAQAMRPDHHTYTFVRADSSLGAIHDIRGYERIVYKGVYPGVDVVYTIHPEKGIKYDVVLAPGADPTQVRMRYAEGRQLNVDNEGNLVIGTSRGDIIDHAPVAYYKGNKAERIGARFKVEGSTVSFQLDAHDRARGVVIDPWVVTPPFPNSNKIWDVEVDAASNVYIHGGDTPIRVRKYDPTGNLLWTYNTPWDTSNYWIGSLVTDPAGNSFLTAGTSPRIARINPNGGLVWSANGGGFDEYWRMSFNCDYTEMVLGGTRLSIGPSLFPVGYGRAFRIDLNSGAATAGVNVAALSPSALIDNPNEIRALTASPNGRYYFLTLDTIGSITEDLAIIYRRNNSYQFSYKVADFGVTNQPVSAITATANHIYTQNGTTLHKRNINTGAIIGTVTIPGGASATSLGLNSPRNSGIALDSCGNVVVGSMNAVHMFDADLNFIASAATPGPVYDVAINHNGEVVASGQGFVASVTLATCAPPLVVCCYSSIDAVGPLCVNGDPVVLTAETPGGVWSGPGIVNASTGQFDPGQAGVGAHEVTYTLACGSSTYEVIVGPCAPLSVCFDPATNSYTASNGVGPYVWEQQTTVQDCSACFLACFVPTGCAVNVFAWGALGTGQSIPAPTSFPIRVTDAAGTVLVINSAADVPECTPCPTIVTVASNVVDVQCGGQATGGAIVSASGGTAPYTYTWAPGNLTGAVQATLGAGTYQVTATDAAGCTGNVTVTIAQPPVLEVAVGDVTDVTCAGDDGAASVTVTGGTPDYTYLWNTGSTLPALSGISQGVYTVEVTDANGCTGTTTVVVASTDGPVISDISSTPSACAPPDGTIEVLATGTDLEYSIDGGATYQSGNTFAEVAGGTYTVLVRDEEGCISSGTITVDAPPAPVPVITGVDQGCTGDTLVLATAQTYAGYEWSTGSTQPTTGVTTTSDVTVTVTDTDGCVGISAPFPVTFSGPQAVFTTDPLSPQLPGTTVDFLDNSTASGGTLENWWWDFGGEDWNATGPNVSWTYDEPGSYPVTLIVTDSNGCTDTVTTVYIIRPADITVPNVFSPNGDGMNDTFNIENIEFFGNELVIINRWGNTIFSANNYRNQWNASGFPDGTYYYVLRLEDGREFTGHVTVLR